MPARYPWERRVATVTDLFSRVKKAPRRICWSAVTSASEAVGPTTCVGSLMALGPFSVDPTTRTAAAVGKKPITPTRHTRGIGIKRQRVRIGECLVRRLHRDLVPGQHVVLAVADTRRAASRGLTPMRSPAGPGRPAHSSRIDWHPGFSGAGKPNAAGRNWQHWSSSAGQAARLLGRRRDGSFGYRRGQLSPPSRRQARADKQLRKLPGDHLAKARADADRTSSGCSCSPFDQTAADLNVAYQPGGTSRLVRGRARTPRLLARSGRQRPAWQPIAVPPGVMAPR